MEPASLHGQWSSRWIYFLAATGSAVGLGNIWKFPYITGVYGGGAFVLVYLACILLVGLPLLIAEAAIGRRGRCSPPLAFERLALEIGKSPGRWRVLGWLGAITGFLILSFYTVVAGWALYYAAIAGGGAFVGTDGTATGALFAAFTADAKLTLLCSTLFLTITLVCVGKGVEKGLEQALRFTMPLMLLLLLLLVGYATTQGAFGDGVSFLFAPDFSRLSLTGVLVALGHAFFTLGLGAGAMMIYGAYMPTGLSLPRTAVDIALADTAIALLAGLALFPLVFAYGLEPARGPALVFVTLPIAFGQMPGGSLLGFAFFTMLTLAAFTSAISMIEALVAALIERRRWSRWRSTAVCGIAVWLVSLGTVGSFSWGSQPLLFGRKFFSWLDFVTSNVLLPVVSLFTALFVGFLMRPHTLIQTLQGRSLKAFKLWYWVLRYVAVPAILVVMVAAIAGRT